MHRTGPCPSRPSNTAADETSKAPLRTAVVFAAAPQVAQRRCVAALVRSRLQLGFAVALGLAGCSGNIVQGVPLDGGTDFGDPTAATGEAGVTVIRAQDARAASPSGAGSATGKPSDSGTSSSPAGPSNPASNGTAAKDAAAAGAAQPPVAQSDAGPATSARDYSTDKSKFLGSSRCDQAKAAGVQFCDDFEQTEGGNPGPAWSYPFGFMPTIDSKHAARGTRALLFANTTGNPGHIEETSTFPAANNSFYGRMFVWIDQLPTAADGAHWALVGAKGDGNPAEVRVDGQLVSTPAPGHNFYGVGSDFGDSGDWHTSGTEPQSSAQEKVWTCLEWRFKGDTSETQVWIDGVEQVSLHTTSKEFRPGDQEMGKTFTHPTYQRLRIGWWIYQNNSVPAANNVWLDEIAIDDERIGCVL